MPSTPLRRQLRGAGHALDPIVQIGKQGSTDAVIKQLGQALLDHELVKVKLGSECPVSRFELAETLGAEPGVQVVQILGRTILLYKRHPKKPKYESAPDATKNGGARGSASAKKGDKRGGKKSDRRRPNGRTRRS